MRKGPCRARTRCRPDRGLRGRSVRVGRNLLAPNIQFECRGQGVCARDAEKLGCGSALFRSRWAPGAIAQATLLLLRPLPYNSLHNCYLGPDVHLGARDPLGTDLRLRAHGAKSLARGLAHKVCRVGSPPEDVDIPGNLRGGELMRHTLWGGLVTLGSSGSEPGQATHRSDALCAEVLLGPFAQRPLEGQISVEDSTLVPVAMCGGPLGRPAPNSVASKSKS